MLTDNNKFTVGLFVLWELRCSGFSVMPWSGEAEVLHGFCRNRLGRGLWFEQLPQPFTVRNGVPALSLRELLCPVLLLVFGFSMVSLALITELGDAEGVTRMRHPDGPCTL